MSYIKIDNRVYPLDSVYIGAEKTIWEIKEKEFGFCLCEISTSEEKDINIIKYLKEVKKENIEDVLDCESAE